MNEWTGCIFDVDQPDDELDRRQFRLQHERGVGERDALVRQRHVPHGRNGGHAAAQSRPRATLHGAGAAHHAHGQSGEDAASVSLVYFFLHMFTIRLHSLNISYLCKFVSFPFMQFFRKRDCFLICLWRYAAPIIYFLFVPLAAPLFVYLHFVICIRISPASFISFLSVLLFQFYCFFHFFLHFFQLL